jgi:hypothetical protein
MHEDQFGVCRITNSECKYRQRPHATCALLALDAVPLLVSKRVRSKDQLQGSGNCRDSVRMPKYTHIPLYEIQTRTRVNGAVAFVVSTHYGFVSTEINSGISSGEIVLLETRQLLN